MSGWLLSLAAVALVQLIWPGQAQAAKALKTVAVADPYLVMHTGPGRGYPIFNVVDRGETVAIVRQKTDWFKVRGPDGKEGWVAKHQMELTLATLTVGAPPRLDTLQGIIEQLGGK